MKPRLYAISVALLLAAIFLLWPRTSPQPPSADADPPRPTAGGGGPASPSRELPRPKVLVDTLPAVRAPEVADLRLSPESPPEQTLEWRIARQEAMLRTLDRHLESTESKLRNAADPAERRMLSDQLDILRVELTNQQNTLRQLQE